MALSAHEKAAAQAIVNIFETGSIRGDYAMVTLLPGDSGQLTYGRSQTTLASGNLYLLIKDYAARVEGAFSAILLSYLPFLETRDAALNHDLTFRQLLKDAGGDPVMHEVQDIFFDRVYWASAMRSAEALGVETALGRAIVYDSVVHGSWALIRDLTRKRHGELKKIGEKKWFQHYVRERRQWLATHRMRILHKTVYRMDAFEAIIKADNWKLALPFAVRGRTITSEALGAAEVVPITAEEAPRRLLRLRSPAMTGTDITWAQERLNQAGFSVPVNGTFDETTDKVTRAFQEKLNLKIDGIIGPVTRAALEDLSLAVPAAQIVVETTAMPSVVEASPSAVPPPEAAPPAEEPPATTPTPAPAQPMTPAPPSPPSEAVTPTGDLRAQLTHEIRAGFDSVNKQMRTDNQTTINAITGVVRQEVGGVLTTLRENLRERVRGRIRDIIGQGRPIAAATLGGAVLALTEARDILVRYLGEGAQQDPGALWTELTRALQPVRELAAQLPDDGATALRLIALALIAYVVWPLVTRYLDGRKAERDIDRGTGD